MTADEILAIPMDRPDRLFSMAQMKEQRKALALRWHPDRNGSAKASAVFQHINALYDRATQMVESGGWSHDGSVVFKANTGKAYNIRYRRKIDVDIGDMLVDYTSVMFLLNESGASDLIDHGISQIGSFTFPSDRIREEMMRYLPAILQTLENDRKVAVIIEKAPDNLLLRDVLDHYGGRIDPKHVAWMLSSLWNIASYLQISGIVHPAISIDTVFVSPLNHSTSLLGGWWFSAKAGEKLRAVPAKTLALLPASLLKSKQASARMNGELIKAIGRQLLGDVGGSSLRARKDIPAPMVEWLMLPATNDAIKDYGIWQRQVLKDSFGERKFFELTLTADDVYK